MAVAGFEPSIYELLVESSTVVLPLLPKKPELFPTLSLSKCSGWNRTLDLRIIS